jgi:hypothetical protein
MLCYRRYVSLHPLFAHSRPARPCVALNLARVKRKHCPGLIRARGETIKNRLKLGKQKNINLNRLLACSKLFFLLPNAIEPMFMLASQESRGRRDKHFARRTYASEHRINIH